MLGEGLRRAARPRRVLRDHGERRLAELEGGGPRLTLDHLDAQVAQLEHVAHVVRAGNDPQTRKVHARDARELRDGGWIVERDDQQVGALRAGGVQKIEARRVAVEDAKAEFPKLLDIIRVVVEHRRMEAARIEKPGHYLAHPAEAGDDHLRRLRRFGRARRHVGEARRDDAVVGHKQERRCDHRERHGERDRQGGLLVDRAVVRGEAENHESELAALREEQDEERPFALRQPRALADQPEERGLQNEEHDDDADDQPRPGKEEGEVDAHADRDEEEAQEQPLERLDRRFDLVPVLRFGEQHAGEEGAERHRQARDLEEERDAEDEQQREGGKNFTQARAGDMAEDRPRDEVAEHERADDHRHREADALPGKPGPAAGGAE